MVKDLILNVGVCFFHVQVLRSTRLRQSGTAGGMLRSARFQVVCVA